MHVEFLELAILMYLMNDNLRESAQETLRLAIAQTRKARGEEILPAMRKCVSWESMMGPEDITEETLDAMRTSVYNKLSNYRKFGNFNL